MKPYITVILAMSADGKITSENSAPARFSSQYDLNHLQTEISANDGVLFGGETLRVYHTTMSVFLPHLVEKRKLLNKPPQPIQIVCSPSGNFSTEMRFFQQPIPRWLITSNEGAQKWQNPKYFHKIMITEMSINWRVILSELFNMGIKRLAVIGGGKLVASLFQEGVIDELYLTICPLILGGKNAPTPADGRGFLPENAPKLQLLSIKHIDQEIFLHYRVSQIIL